MRSRSHPAALALLCLALAMAPLAGCQGEARTTADCDQLLNEEKYSDVIRKCDDPFHLASAYLGLGGFDTFLLVDDSAADGKLAQLLGLTTANIDTRREYFNKALEVVSPPHGGSQAFALLVASFLGLTVTTSQYLDNGIGGDAALNDTYAQQEIEGAVGFPFPGTGSALTVHGSNGHYSVQYGGKSYVIDCAAATNPCGSDDTAEVYDDPDGSGMLDISPGESADAATVRTNIASVASGALVVQLADIDVGITLTVAARDPTTSYLGRAAAPVTFNLGMSDYLTALNRAKAELQASAGSTGGSAVTDQIDAITTQLDNGFDCGSSNPALAALLAPLDEIAQIYLPAAGTLSRKATGNYAGLNLVASAAIPVIGLLFPSLAATPTAFTVVGYKILYPTQVIAGFDLTNATPRVDNAHSAFQSSFEDIWLFAPAASPAGDNAVNIAEVMCANDI